MIWVDIAHQHEVDDAGVLTFRVIINQVSAFEVAEPADDVVNDLIDAHHFADHGFQFRKERMLLICLIEDLAPGLFSDKEFSSGELIEFFPHRVGRNIEFFG